MLFRSTQESRLLDSIYSAALNQSLWPQVAERVAAYVGSHQSIIIATGPQSPLTDEVISYGVNPEIHEHYEQIIGEDVWLNGMLSLPAGSTCTGLQFISTPDLLRTRMYVEHCKPSDVMYMAGGIAINDGENFLCLGCQTSGSTGPLGKDSIRNIRAILKHIDRAMFVSRRMMEVEIGNQQLRAVLNKSRFGIVVLGPGNRVLWSNESANVIFSRRDGIYRDLGVFRLADANSNKRISASVHRLQSTSIIEAGDAETYLTAPRLHSALPYYLTVCTVSQSVCMGQPHSSVAVFILDPENPPNVSERALRAFYGLTEAEIRVCLLLLNRYSLAEIADRLEVSLNTVRTQLKSIFQKCEVRSQGQLLLKLANCSFWVN